MKKLMNSNEKETVNKVLFSDEETVYDVFFNKKLTINDAYMHYENFVQLCLSVQKDDLDNFFGNQGLFKKVHNEILPCIFFAQHCILKDFSIKHIEFTKDTSKQYDAVIYDYSNNHIKIEVVTAINHRDWAIRKEHMDKHGRVSLYGKIKYTGSKHNRVMEYSPCQTISYSDMKQQKMDWFFDEIPKSFNKKLEKQNQDKIYQNMILLIYIDDKCPIHPSEFNNYLENIASSLKKIPNNFDGIYIVRSSGYITVVKPYHGHDF